MLLLIFFLKTKHKSFSYTRLHNRWKANARIQIITGEPGKTMTVRQLPKTRSNASENKKKGGFMSNMASVFIGCVQNTNGGRKNGCVKPIFRSIDL